MNSFLIYMLEVNIFLLLAGGLYKVLLKNQPAFHFNRGYLLSILLLAFALPFIPIPNILFRLNAENSLIKELSPILLPMVNIGEGIEQNLSLDIGFPVLVFGDQWIILMGFAIGFIANKSLFYQNPHHGDDGIISRWIG